MPSPFISAALELEPAALEKQAALAAEKVCKPHASKGLPPLYRDGAVVLAADDVLRAVVQGGDAAVELVRLKEAAVAAEEEMSRGRSKLRQAAADLKRLASTASKDERAVSSTLTELRSLPSKRALELRTEIAKTKTEMSRTSSGIDAALRRVFKAGVDI